MKRLFTFIVIIALLAIGAIGGVFWEKSSKKVAPTIPVKEARKERNIQYYKCPMGQPDYSQHPGKAQCGMDYIPVYEDEAETVTRQGEIYITPEKIQRIGVRSEEVKETTLKKVIRTVATVDYDERRLFTINTKIEGWIENLLVNATGRQVKKGEPLMDIYSPELVSTQEEYLLALETKKRLGPGALHEAVEGADSILDATRRRLGNWDISDAQIEALEKSRKPTKTLTLHSPVEGIVIEKMALQGLKFMPGEKLFTIADLSHIWLFVDVYEYELSLVKPGQRAKVTVNAYPGEVFNAVISYIYPYMNSETRTAKVRLEMNNPGLRLKPGMYANVELESIVSPKAVAVPEDAVLDTGERQAVILDLGAGRFKVLDVKVGLKGEGYYHILSGLAPGWKVVTSANFLIDSESSFRSTAQTMPGMKHGEKEENVGAGLKPAPTTPPEHKGH
ncbi:MAG: efflux RND transporter periplasmic adaptor subunit [Deltaproteobacteria bacterium]|nr:efflux RND transporter periplasmic adaptor subunit [Deltaproteobacteria bacterium]